MAATEDKVGKVGCWVWHGVFHLGLKGPVVKPAAACSNAFVNVWPPCGGSATVHTHDLSLRLCDGYSG